MLTLTTKATEILNRIGSNPQTSDTVGVRISRDGVATNSLGVALADAPHGGDQVVETDGGGRVYLGELAVDALKGKTLDVQTDDETGRIQFGIQDPAA